MPSAHRRALISRSMIASIALVVTGCAGATHIVAYQSACSTQIADSLRQDVPPVARPSERATAGDLWVGFDGQTGQLDVANRFKRAAIQTVERCEARDRATLARLQAPFWRRPFMRPSP